VALSAKKKKGPAGSFDLDALEAMEALYDGTPAAAAAAPAATSVAGGGEAGGEELDKKALKAKKKAEKIAAAAAEAGGDEDEGNKKSKKDKGGKDAKKDAKQKGKKGGKDDGDAAAAQAPEPVAQAPVAELDDPNAMSMEDRVRKARPKARVQIAESSQPGYVSLRLDDVAVVFRNQEVLKSANWEVRTGDRVGLVGANGCGKTTMVRILAGDVEPTAGTIVKSSQSLRVAFLKQEFTDELVPSQTLRDEFKSVFGGALSTLAALADAEARLGSLEGGGGGGDGGGAEGDKMAAMEVALEDMAKLQEQARRQDAYAIDAKVDRVLGQMGFMPDEAALPVASFSGGWKMRIGLGKILLSDPNLLLLDEPTNHLDLESVEWLEAFLVLQNIPMVIVSHDREFLDKVCTKIVDCQDGVTSTYDGKEGQGCYTRFLKLKKAKMDAWGSAYETQQKKIKEEKAWINVNKAKPGVSSQRQQREAKLEKLLKGEGNEELVARPPNDKRKFRFRFPPPPRVSSADEAATIQALGHGYPGNVLFKDANLRVQLDDRVAVLGPNGCGKSTLLRCLVGQEEPQHGAAAAGPNVAVNYFEQSQADGMDLDDTVVGVLQKAATQETYEQLRALLGQFMFKGDAVEKRIAHLSGGEKARVALCRMMLRPANLLVLDEPTNHLDIPAKEMLEEALQHYEGAMLLISHDRYFVSQVATTVVAVEDKALSVYSGDYKFYLDNRPDVLEKVAARLVAGDAREIGHAKKVDPNAEGKDRKKNFGGSGTTSGDKSKGIKNAKRVSL